MLIEFTRQVRGNLEKRLEPISLKLHHMDILKDRASKIKLPDGVDRYVIAGWVEHTSSSETKSFRSLIGLDLGETEAEDIMPLVDDIVANLKTAFYPEPNSDKGIHV